MLDLREIPWLKDPTKAILERFTPSSDLVSFIIDISNSEETVGGLKNITTQTILPIKISNCTAIEFSPDNKSIIYVTKDSLHNSPSYVYQQYIGSKDSPTLIYSDEDPAHYVDIAVSKSKEYIIVSSNTKEDSEVGVVKMGGDWKVDMVKERE